MFVVRLHLLQSLLPKRRAVYREHSAGVAKREGGRRKWKKNKKEGEKAT